MKKKPLEKEKKRNKQTRKMEPYMLVLEALEVIPKLIMTLPN